MKFFFSLFLKIGVMRYLQNEWQRNERDRIQWDLERAEMKV